MPDAAFPRSRPDELELELLLASCGPAGLLPDDVQKSPPPGDVPFHHSAGSNSLFSKSQMQACPASTIIRLKFMRVPFCPGRNTTATHRQNLSLPVLSSKSKPTRLPFNCRKVYCLAAGPAVVFNSGQSISASRTLIFPIRLSQPWIWTWMVSPSTTSVTMPETSSGAAEYDGISSRARRIRDIALVFIS